MCPFECEALQQLRQYRAHKAERAVQAARRAQRAVESEIEQARIAVEQARQHEEQSRTALLDEHQGQVLSPRGLMRWSEAERTLTAATARETEQLLGLIEQWREQGAHLERACEQAAECLRQVEKIRVLAEKSP